MTDDLQPEQNPHWPSDPAMPPSNPAPPMEVHHHGHAHGNKTWKAYLFEFFMLFLAVFCGFLAEYYLEHRIEKERSKQFIESFYEDLKTDTARMSFYTDFDQDKIDALAGLGACYDAITKDQRNTNCLLNIIKQSSINRPFIYTDRTLRQLANAGGFRLLKKEDADSIIFYTTAYDNFQDFQSTVFQGTQDNVRKTLSSMLNFKANLEMFKPQEGKAILTEAFGSPKIDVPLLVFNDKEQLNRYFNELLMYYRITYNHKKMLLDLRNTQLRLLKYFSSKYHLD
jgi:hypothetical protein